MTSDSITIICFYLMNFVIPILTYTKTDWCSVKCNGKKSIVCKYGMDCTPTEPCTTVRLDEKKVLNIHNNLRRKFASGEEIADLDIGNMKQLYWNESLALTARCTLINCLENTSPDECLATPSLTGHIGQNTLSLQSKTNDCASEAITAVIKWYNEVKLAKKHKLFASAHYYFFIEEISHFIQIVWADTIHLGCAMTEVPFESGKICSMACNYSPGGNIVGERAYSLGMPCSDCGELDWCNLDLCKTFFPRNKTNKTSNGPRQRIHISIKILMVSSIFLAQFK